MYSIKKGIVWSAIDRFSVQGIQFVLSIIIARLISPSAYGILVIAMVFINFANLFVESGFKDALVQKKDRKESDYYTIFIFNLAISLFLYLVIYLLSGYIASFYSNSELENVLKVLPLSLVFSSLSITQLVKLTVDMNFEKQTKARFFSTLVSGFLGILFAFKGFEVWALVIQAITNSFLSSVILMVLVRWRPHFIFDFVSFKKLFSFGYKLLLSNILTSLYIQITNLFIGKIYNPAQLAFYDRGFHLSQYPSVNVSSVICRVTFPALCKQQDNKEELERQYLKYLHFSCFCIFPLMCLLAATSKPVVLLLLTDKWIGCASFISIFCGVFFFYPLIESGMVLLNAVGLSHVNLKGVIYKRLISAMLLFSTVFISVKAVAVGLIFGNIVECIINSLLIRKHIGISVKKQFEHLMDIFVISILAGFSAYMIASVFESFLIGLILSLSLGSIIYLFLCFLFKVPEIFVICKIAKSKYL